MGKTWIKGEFAESVESEALLWGETAGRKSFRLADSRLLGSLPHLIFEAVAA